MTTPTSPTTRVSDQPNRGRFEATVDGEHAGYAYYRRENGVVTFTHTEVEDAYEGQGVGSALVAAALADVRAAGQVVRPECPFVRAYMERHPDSHDLLATT